MKYKKWHKSFLRCFYSLLILVFTININLSGAEPTVDIGAKKGCHVNKEYDIIGFDSLKLDYSFGAAELNCKIRYLIKGDKGTLLEAGAVTYVNWDKETDITYINSRAIYLPKGSNKIKVSLSISNRAKIDKKEIKVLSRIKKY